MYTLQTFLRQTRLGAAAVLALTGAAAASCVADETLAPVPQQADGPCPAALNARPEGAPWAPAEDEAAPVSASFSVTVDASHPALDGEQRDPQAAPLQITTLSGDLALWGGVKRFVLHPERLYLELYVINDGPAGIRDAAITVSAIEGSAAFRDLQRDVWAAPTDARTVPLGGVAPEGVGRLQIGFDAAPDGGPISFRVDLAGVTTRRAAASSAPVQVTPDGAEAWAAFADSDVVSVIDTAVDARVAQIPVAGRPSSVALTPDGALALVACAACNQLQVIDRRRREVVQILGEDEGIGREPRHVVVSPDGARAYVSAYVGDSVTALTRVGDAFRVVKEIPVGRRPLGLSVTPDGQTVYVSHFMPRGKIWANEGWISVIAADRLEKAGEAALRDEGNAGDLECLRLLPGFDQYTGRELSNEGVPTQLAGVFLSPGGDVAWIPGLRTAPVPILEGDPSQIGFTFVVKGANSPAAMFTLSALDPRAPEVTRTTAAIDVPDRSEEILRCLDMMEEIEAVVDVPDPEDPARVLSPGAAVPSGTTPLSEAGVSRFIAWSRGGRRALSLGYIADEILVMDGATRHPVSRRHVALSGSNPLGLALTPDGKKGYVVYESSTFASVLDLSALAEEGDLPRPGFVPYQLVQAEAGQGSSVMTFRILARDAAGIPDLPPITETAQVPLVDDDPLDPVLRRGKILFNSSNPEKYPTLSGIREAACASCHPDGGNDGTVWSTVEGERRTMGLWGGTAGRGWLHASATHADSADFATIIVKERLGGTGLTPEDEHALAEYVARGIPEVQRPRVDEALAAEGAAIFGARCASCHVEEWKWSSGAPDAASPYGGGREAGPELHDVGSAAEWAGAILGEPYVALFPPVTQDVLTQLRGDRELGSKDEVQAVLKYTPRPDRKRGELKAPSLVNTWENAVFFHDGRASSLEEAVVDIAARTGAPLTEPETRALVAFLKTL